MAGASPSDRAPDDDRRRLHRAITAVVAEKGYADTTVADVVERAGVPRSAFFAHFTDKEECFIAAYVRAADAHLRLVMAASEGLRDPREVIRARVGAHVRIFADEPGLARAFVRQIVAAGPRAVEEHHRQRDRYVDLLMDNARDLRAQSPELPEVPREVLVAAVSSVDELILRYLGDGATMDVDRVERAAVYVLLSVLGVPGAAEVLHGAGPAASGRRCRA